jgi:hypothetical protein
LRARGLRQTGRHDDADDQRLEFQHLFFLI